MKHADEAAHSGRVRLNGRVELRGEESTNDLAQHDHDNMADAIYQDEAAMPGRRPATLIKLKLLSLHSRTLLSCLVCKRRSW